MLIREKTTGFVWFLKFLFYFVLFDFCIFIYLFVYLFIYFLGGQKKGNHEGDT